MTRSQQRSVVPAPIRALALRVGNAPSTVLAGLAILAILLTA